MTIDKAQIKNWTEKWYQRENGDWYIKKGIGPRGHPLELKGVIKQCDHCGSNYLVTTGSAKTQKYCSVDCSIIGKRKYKVVTEDDAPLSDAAKISSPENPINAKDWSREGTTWWKFYSNGVRTKGTIRQCDCCSEYFLCIPSQIHTRFCSKRCAGYATTIQRQLEKERKDFSFKRKFGEKSHTWKGGKNKLEDGYVEVYAPEHPYARGGKYVREHRLIMEQKLGRYLSPTETVHHINGIRDDNRIENLELRTGAHGAGIRIVDITKEYLKSLSTEELKQFLAEIETSK